MRPTVAIVGGGVAGLSAAYALRDRCDVTLFERDDRLGGHANSIEVVDGGRSLGLETAFAVFNDPHYPRLSAFFQELGVATLPHRGGFSFFDNGAGWRYTSEELEAPEGTSAMERDPMLARIKLEAERFYRDSPRDFIRRRADVPLGEYLDREGYSEDFKWGFIVLICSAAWSVPATSIWQMSASTVIAFFWGHGQGGLGGRSVEWRTVDGGSAHYVRAVTRALDASNARILLNTAPTAVRETAEGVVVQYGEGRESTYSSVIMAAHLDDSLAIADISAERRTVLEIVQYGPTTVHLHTDPAVMPTDRAAWRSWNYGRRTTDGGVQTWVVYYLNQLQGFDAGNDYFTTLDYPGEIDRDLLIAEIQYRHPVISHAVREKQDDLRRSSVDGRIKFCGGYLHSRKLGIDIIGMHESAFDSGLAAAESVLASAV